MKEFINDNHVVSQDFATTLGQIWASGTLVDCVDLCNGPPRVLGSYALVYLFDGSGWFHDGNGYTHKVSSGDVLFLFPDMPHSYGPGPGEKWNEFYSVFDGPAFDLWRKVGLLDPAMPVRHLTPEDYWLERLQNAAEAVKCAVPNIKTLELSRFLSLITEVLGADVPGDMEPTVWNWLAYARFLLETDLNEVADLAHIARQTGMSYESFRKRFQHQTGVSPAHYRMMRRIQVARDLLRDTSMKNREVAECLGFSDECSFYRQFKQSVGMTPRDFRQSLPIPRTDIDEPRAEGEIF